MRLGLTCDAGLPDAQVLDLLERCGLPVETVRMAAWPVLAVAGPVTWLVAPGADVLAACVRGGLDAAVVGKELLLELAPPVHELLDLRLCRDALVYAAPDSGAGTPRRDRPRVATPYPAVTRRHFAASGRQVEIIGFDAARLAPRLGVADGVVDLRRRLFPDGEGDGGTGRLSVREEVAACSARLVAGRSARALSGELLAALCEDLRAAWREA